MTHPLQGKVIIITGASSGIGAATARAMAPLGCKLVLAARTLERLQAIAAELGESAIAVQADVTDAGDVKRMVDAAVARFGRVDVMFANAGIYIPGVAAEGDPDAWAGLIDTNVTGVMRCMHAVLPHMLAQRSGDILVTSSISGHIDIPWEPVYSASKHAVQSFVHTLRRQVAASNIRVGSIAPGRVANELWGADMVAQIEEQVNAHRSLRSEDVAHAVIFMLSQPAHVTIRDLVMLPQNQDL
jgi:ribitol 2-dehydrogenase